MDVVYATPEIVERFYGKRPERSMRAVAFVDGERVVGLAGVCTEQCAHSMFAELNDEIRRDKRALVKGARAVMKLVGRMPVHALADPDVKGSEALLEHMGFEQLEDRVYVWPPLSRS